MEYDILISDVRSQLCREVELRMVQGWTLVGGVSVSTHNTEGVSSLPRIVTYFAQAMTRHLEISYINQEKREDAKKT